MSADDLALLLGSLADAIFVMFAPNEDELERLSAIVDESTLRA